MGVAKLAYWITINYEKPMGCMLAMVFYLIMRVKKGETFVTRKITRGLARIDEGLEKCIYLGNLNARRDWGMPRLFICNGWYFNKRSQTISLFQQEE